jgi:hypothetical protein
MANAVMTMSWRGDRRDQGGHGLTTKRPSMTRTLQLMRALAASRAALAPVAAGAAASLAATRGAFAVAPAAAVAAARGLHGSASRLGIGSHMSDNDPVVLEKEKQRSLAKEHLPGGGGVPDVEGWSEALASDSEAVVRPASLLADGSATDVCP